jgi:hypothetical protein
MAKTRSAHLVSVRLTAIVLAAAISMIAGTVYAQSGGNLPPPGAYQPIPNYTGVGAGLLFRNAINDRFSGVQPVSPTIVNLAFANLPTEQDGALIYCNDCVAAVPCAAGGSSVWAFGAQGQWECAAPGKAAAGANSDITSMSAVQTMTAPAAGGAITNYDLNGALVLTNPKYGICAGGDGTAGATDCTASINAVVAAANPGQTIIVPSLPSGQCYKYSQVTITKPVWFIGQGWNHQNWGAYFAQVGYRVATAAQGGVFCSSTTQGRSFVFAPTGTVGQAGSAGLANLLFFGPGVNGSAATITNCTESSTTATCTTSAAHGINADDEVFILGNSVADYNGVASVATVPTSTSFTFEVRKDLSGLGTGSGGTVTPLSVGVSFGDLYAATNHYASGITVRNVGITNFGNCASVHAQNSNFDFLQVDGCYADGLYNDSASGYGSSNNDQFTRFTASGRNHMNIDFANPSQSVTFSAFDLEDPAHSDSTARSIYCSNCNEAVFQGGYIEDNSGGAYAGTDDVQIDTGYNSIGATLINLHITGSATSNSIHVTGAAHTTIIGGQMASILLDSTDYYVNLLYPDATTITDNTTGTAPNCSNILKYDGTVGGTCTAAFTKELTMTGGTHLTPDGKATFGGAVSVTTGGLWLGSGSGSMVRFGGQPAIWDTGAEMIMDNLSSTINDWKIQVPLRFGTIYSAAGTPVPSATSISHGRLCVSDSTSCTSGTNYTSGGSTACELWSDGTNWKESGSGC